VNISPADETPEKDAAVYLRCWIHTRRASAGLWLPREWTA